MDGPIIATEPMAKPGPSARVTLVNQKTGERVECWRIDAGEIRAGVDGGDWVEEVAAAPEVEPVVTDAGPASPASVVPAASTVATSDPVLADDGGGVRVERRRGRKS